MSTYRPSSGTEGAMFEAAYCDRCIHDTVDIMRWDGCPILAATMVLSASDPDYPKEWVKVDGAGTCTKFRLRPAGWHGPPLDPYAVEKKQAAYEALPRDPTTGRPVI